MSEIQSTNYCRMANIYNPITKLISMNGNQRSQQYFLKYVKENVSALNIGCGSVSFGIDLGSKCKNVTAIDISPKMVAIAKKNAIEKNLQKNINFICSDILQYEPETKYDIVFANFFLNTFKQKDVSKVLKHILSMVKPGGLFCIADEVNANKVISRIELLLFRPMLTLFHSILANHPFHPIYDHKPIILENGFDLIDEKRDKTDYICSYVYKKKDSV